MPIKLCNFFRIVENIFAAQLFHDYLHTQRVYTEDVIMFAQFIREFNTLLYKCYI